MSTTTRPMPVWRRHPCKRNHRTYLTLAKCMFKRAWYVHEGEFGSAAKPLKYAVVFRCRKWYDKKPTPPRVTLWTSPDTARLKANTLCGGGCYNHHDIIELRK